MFLKLRFAAALLLLVVPMSSFAQAIVASTDSANYTRCVDTIGSRSAERVHSYMTIMIESYNLDRNDGVRMSNPVVDECYVSTSKPGSLMAGLRTIQFYTDGAHFQCSIAGNCSGELAGYQAHAMILNDELMFTANTGRANNMVQACLSSSGFNEGRCN